MSYKLIVRKRAEKQIAEAFSWYEEQRKGLGNEFLFCIDAQMQTINKSPKLFQVKYRDVHCALVPRFPYGIFYFVDETKIVVVAVFHLSRDPQLWRR